MLSTSTHQAFWRTVKRNGDDISIENIPLYTVRENGYCGRFGAKYVNMSREIGLFQAVVGRWHRTVAAMHAMRLSIIYRFRKDFENGHFTSTLKCVVLL